MELKLAQKKSWDISYRSKCLESMSSDTLLAFQKEVQSFLKFLNKQDENDSEWKELQCSMLAMEYFVITQYSMLTKGDYFSGMYEDEEVCTAELPQKEDNMERKRLEDVADIIDIEECLDLPDDELREEIKKELIDMFEGLEEHAFTGKSKKHPLLNGMSEKERWEAINLVYDLRVEFELLKFTNKNPDIVVVQLAMQEPWEAFGSDEYSKLDDEEEERFLKRVESFREQLKEIDSPSYDLKRLDFDCMTICSIIMMNQNVKQSGSALGESAAEDFFSLLTKDKKKVG